MFDFFKNVKGEMSHVVWPTRKQTIVFTIVVILISIGIAYYMGLFDYIFTQLLGEII
jgi:preprotein translocase subunit SecE